MLSRSRHAVGVQSSGRPPSRDADVVTPLDLFEPWNLVTKCIAAANISRCTALQLVSMPVVCHYYKFWCLSCLPGARQLSSTMTGIFFIFFCNCCFSRQRRHGQGIVFHSQCIVVSGKKKWKRHLRFHTSCHCHIYSQGIRKNRNQAEF